MEYTSEPTDSRIEVPPTIQCWAIYSFYCPKLRLAVEIDGGQHNEMRGIMRDEVRTKYLRHQNIKVLRVWNNDILNNIECVIESILSEITPPRPPLILRGGSKSPPLNVRGGKGSY